MLTSNFLSIQVSCIVKYFLCQIHSPQNILSGYFILQVYPKWKIMWWKVKYILQIWKILPYFNKTRNDWLVINFILWSATLWKLILLECTIVLLKVCEMGEKSELLHRILYYCQHITHRIKRTQKIPVLKGVRGSGSCGGSVTNDCCCGRGGGGGW